MTVWMNGRLMDANEARIPITDHGLLYGDGLFEGIRLRHGKLLWLDRHLARLTRGATAIGLTLPLPAEEIGEVVRETLRAHGQPEAYVRLLVTRGEGALGVDPTSCPKPSLICLAARISLFSDEQQAQGLALVTASQRKPDPDVLDSSVKSLNYLGSVLAKLEAKQAGADDALMLNKQGLVAEASVANVFAVHDGVLSTPPVTAGCLPGINRAAVMHLAPSLGLAVRECSLGRADLFGADEVFLTGSGAGVVGVRSLDGRPIGAGKSGRVTARVAAALGALFLSDGETVLPVETAPESVDLPNAAPAA
jgi:branched-chain amino acid aminotransferase